MKTKKCPDCLHAIERPESNYSYCSSFCCEVPEKDRRAWQTAERGTWCIYPCAKCGCAIEDEISKERICSSCWPEYSLKKLLRQYMRQCA